MKMKLGSVPVRIRPGFLVVSAIFGGASRDPRELAVWIAVAFVSILFHELGHAAAGRALGQTPSILLYEAGGLTSFAAGGKPLRTGGHIAISLAGPFAGFLLGSLVYLLARTFLRDSTSPLSALFVHDMLFCNFGWGILNLLPILPLDGGNVAHRALRALHADTADRTARVLSLVVATAGAAWAALTHSWMLALYALAFAGMNLQALRTHPAPAAPGPEDAPRPG